MSIEAMEKALDALTNLQPILANGLLTDAQLKFIDPHIDIASTKLREAISHHDKEQADFEATIKRVQELERQACEIIKREWVGLTDEDIDEASESRTGCEKYAWVKRVIRNAEAKLREKNT